MKVFSFFKISSAHRLKGRDFAGKIVVRNIKEEQIGKVRYAVWDCPCKLVNLKCEVF